ncbi:MAG: phosphoenolpyruvate carboxykinase (ATP) [Desulfovibrionaceae bacterium]|jgi:phosphoenolpyruvate carboxykinase (ATP)|nr:phosphoenolpyruvate carboxykinase (ATP) [Desulfovibrionaceae bacterium]
MASQSTYEFYKNELTRIPPLRAVAETLLMDKRVREVSAAEAYELARAQWDVQETDLEIYPPAARRLELPRGAKVLNHCQGRIVGRTAEARRFFNRLTPSDRSKVLGDLREAVSDLQKRPLIKAVGVVGLDKDLMIKATIIATEDDAMNVFNWLANFTPYAELAEAYEKSHPLPVQDIIVIGDNDWRNEDPFYHNHGGPQLALVDEQANVIFNFGMRYFGERKKGTLTLAWTSGIRVGMAACHGGIKEFDFSNCEDEAAQQLGHRSIAFFGLSGTGKSSHTNAHDNAGTLPDGFHKVVLHDDAFQIDIENKVCRAWEPTLFDKTDSRPLGHQDWTYVIAVMNHMQMDVGGHNLPVGMDLRNANGRALMDRDLLGAYVNRCAFPATMCWLSKDTTLPPIMRYTDPDLAVAMGAALMTVRNQAENVSEKEMGRLVFIPFANPFRVYELWRDVRAFSKVFESGATGYCFNSAGFWRSSDKDLTDIPLKTSLTLQTAVLMDRLEWVDWDLLPGAQIPARDSVEELLPGFYAKYDPAHVQNREAYLALFRERMRRRREYLLSTDLAEKPDLLERMARTMAM